MQKDLATTTFEVFCVVIRAGWEPQQIYSNYFLRLKNQWAIFCISPSTPNGSENLVRVPSSIQNLVSIPSCLCNLGKEMENRKGRGHDPFLFSPQLQLVMYDRERSSQGFSCSLIFFSHHLPAFAEEEEHQRNSCFSLSRILLGNG